MRKFGRFSIFSHHQEWRQRINFSSLQLWSKITAWTGWVQLWKVIIITENDDEKVYLANEWILRRHVGVCLCVCVCTATDYFIVICSILSQVYSIFIYFSSRPFQSQLIRIYASTNLIIHSGGEYWVYCPEYIADAKLIFVQRRYK